MQPVKVGARSETCADMETFFMLSPGIDRQVAIAGYLRKNLRLLEVDDAVLDAIVTGGYSSPNQIALPPQHHHRQLDCPLRAKSKCLSISELPRLSQRPAVTPPLGGLRTLPCRQGMHQGAVGRGGGAVHAGSDVRPEARRDHERAAAGHAAAGLYLFV